MIDRPSSRRFFAMLTACALALIGLVTSGVGGVALLASASVVVLFLVETSYHSFERSHRAATIGVERSTAPYYDLDLG